jgi:anti-sigma-K factor RskA
MLAIDQASGFTPSDEVKNKIFDSLDSENQKRISPAALSQKEVRLEPGVPASNPWKVFAVAASVVALLSAGVAIYYAKQYFDVEERFEIALQQNAVLAEQMQTNQVKMNELDTRIGKFITGNFNKIPMKGEGLPMQEDALVDVFWDKESKEVLLAVNQLAKLDPDNDYQLWAIGDDGPVGIGLVDQANLLGLQTMQLASSAQAFAITIEPKGGSENPTLEKLVVLGEVS